MVNEKLNLKSVISKRKSSNTVVRERKSLKTGKRKEEFKDLVKKKKV